MPAPPRRTAASLALALSLGLLTATSAHAQSADAQTAATAQSLYDQASADMDAGQFARACPKLEEVTRLIPDGLGAKLTLAECYEKAGRLASAWAQYTLVETLAARAGQAERAQQAATTAAALKPRLATLTVEVPEEVRSVTGLAITRDGVTLGEAQWGVTLPIDAGAHTLVATAPGRKPWKEAVQVSGEGAKVAVTVKPLQVEVAAPAPVQAPPPPADTVSERPWQRPVALAAMGVGVIGVGVGAGLGGMAIARNNESNDGHCDVENYCSQEGVDLRNQAIAFGTGATIAMIAGGALLAGGAVLWFTAPTAPSSAKEKVAGKGSTPTRVAVTPGGVLVQGRW
ncbi:tetratricopeptide repeat protein [Chondromyces apiculatus]|nr:tetratricopeptide repeat protein [Chondromyces apiculatus]